MFRLKRTITNSILLLNVTWKKVSKDNCFVVASTKTTCVCRVRVGVGVGVSVGVGVNFGVGVSVGVGVYARGAAGGRVRVALAAAREADVEEHGLEGVAAHALLVSMRCALQVRHHARLAAAVLTTNN